MKKILLLVATIYTIIAPITYHPDTKLVLYYATLGNEKVWNIYKYLNENADSAPKFHYPPVNYWLVKAELPIVKLVGGNNIGKWLGTGSNIAFLDKNIFLYNLATKLPILIMFLITGFVIYKIVKRHGLSENQARFAAVIWYLNPITIFSGVIMGQNDILAIMPFIVGLYFYYEYPLLAFALFGLGGSIKSFPLIWAIALAGVYPTKNIFIKIQLMLVSLFVYGISIFPFLKYDYFVKDVLNSGLAMRMFEKSIYIMGTKILVVPILLVVTTLIGMKNNMGKSIVGVCKLLLTINLVVLGFSNFNPQWFVWIMPFLSIVLITRGSWTEFCLLVISLFGITALIDDKFLYWGIVSPINPNLMNLPYISEFISHAGINFVNLNLFFHLVIMGVVIYWLLQCFRHHE